MQAMRTAHKFVVVGLLLGLLVGCSSDSADELVQDTILKVLNRPEKTQEADNPKAYLMRVLYNLFIDQTRSTKRRPSVPIDDMEFEAPDADQADSMTAKQVVAAMETALEQIAAKPEFAELLASRGTGPVYQNGADARATLSSMKEDATPLVESLTN